MPYFEFKGLDAGGKPIVGMREAETTRALLQLLKREGLFLTELVGRRDVAPTPGQAKSAASRMLSKEVRFASALRNRITQADIATFTRQMATLIKAGVALVESLNAMIDQVESEQLKRILSEVKQQVNEGRSLADALAAHQKIFGVLYVNMIRAGESSGALDSVLLRLAEFTENQAKLRSKVSGALIYPALMAVIGSGVLIMLMTVVVPKVTKIFTEMKMALPLTTRILIGGSSFLQSYWFIILPLFVGTIVLLVRWARSEEGRPKWDRMVLRLPVVGSLVRQLSVARFARTLSTLLKSGVPILSALDIVKNVVTNSVMSNIIDEAKDAIREGESIAAPLKRSGEFPPLVSHMVAIGERSGQLEDMLLNVADSYESAVEVRVGALTALLEPLMIVAMGAIIAFVAFSILMPILQMNTMVR